MKKLILISLILFLGCKKDKDVNASHSCSSIPASSDTLIVDNYRLTLTGLVSSKNEGSLEIIERNGNTINESAGFSINMIQLRNGDNCWETTSIKEMRGQYETYAAIYSGCPSWAKASDTKATIRFKIANNEYYLSDERVNSNN